MKQGGGGHQERDRGGHTCERRGPCRPDGVEQKEEVVGENGDGRECDQTPRGVPEARAHGQARDMPEQRQSQQAVSDIAEAVSRAEGVVAQIVGEDCSENDNSRCRRDQDSIERRSRISPR